VLKLTRSDYTKKINATAKIASINKSIESVSISSLAQLRPQLEQVESALRILTKFLRPATPKFTLPKIAILMFPQKSFSGSLAIEFARYAYSQLDEYKFTQIFYHGNSGYAIFNKLYRSNLKEIKLSQINKYLSSQIYILCPIYFSIIKHDYTCDLIYSPADFAKNLESESSFNNYFLVNLRVKYYYYNALLVENSKRYLAARSACKNACKINDRLRLGRSALVRTLMDLDLLDIN
jgi:F0F1-type ATP synthase gamma subunit